MDHQSPKDVPQPSSQVSQQFTALQANVQTAESPLLASGLMCDSSVRNRILASNLIDRVKNIIESHLKSHKTPNQVVEELEKQGILPDITKEVWKRMQKQNHEFFVEYYKRLKVIEQINCFNNLLVFQKIQTDRLSEFMVPLYLTSDLPFFHRHFHMLQNVANNLSSRYSALQQPRVPITNVQNPNHVEQGLCSNHQCNEASVPPNHHQDQIDYMESTSLPSIEHPNTSIEFSNMEWSDVLLDDYLPSDALKVSGIGIDMSCKTAFVPDKTNAEELQSRTNGGAMHTKATIEPLPEINVDGLSLIDNIDYSLFEY